MIDRVFPLLHFEIRISADSDIFNSLIDDIIPQARFDIGAPSETIHFHICRADEQFLVLMDGEAVMACPDPEWTMVYLHQYMNQCVCSRIFGALMVHGGCGTIGEKRFVLSGGKAAGKTTLLCSLMFNSAAIHADEIVFVSDQWSMPFPRKFHLKEPTLDLMPRLQPSCKPLKRYPSFSDERFIFFSPPDAGFDWVISKKKTDVFFYLEPDSGRPSRVESCPKSVMVQNILFQTLNLDHNAGSQIRMICCSVEAAECYLLYYNDLDGAVRAVTETLRVSPEQGPAMLNDS